MRRVFLIWFGDFVSFWLSLWIILLFQYGNVFNSPIALNHIVPFAILYISWLLIFYLLDLYDIYTIKPTIPHLKRFFLGLIICLIIGVIFFYLIPIFGISPKTNLLLQLVLFGGFSFCLRRLFYHFYSKNVTKDTILVGKKEHLDLLYQSIQNNPQIGLKIICFSEDLMNSLKKYSSIKKSIFILDTENQNIPDIELINIYRNQNEIIDIAEAYERYLYRIPVDYVSKSWIIQNINPRQNVLYRLSGRIFDSFCSVLILIITSPVLLIASLFIYLEDKGHIIYTQERVGLNGKIFKIFKLRSMIVESETDGAVWSSQEDQRITKIGKIIRRTHIDEIPQMVNILKGDISFFGPRPERPEFTKELEKSIPYYQYRHIIRPGFTGWAQIKFKYANSVMTSKEKFEYDLYYIKNKNVFMDFGIFLRTVQIILKR